uniref:Uncharacterized protein n=1 Tax=Electrophorus electricus TaxID=8005 RepID=A0A4W4FQN5_ELEEL
NMKEDNSIIINSSSVSSHTHVTCAEGHTNHLEGTSSKEDLNRSIKPGYDRGWGVSEFSLTCVPELQFVGVHGSFVMLL